MNNIKKLGVTALATSLVAVGAQAGEMAVNGAANITWAQSDGTAGKGLGTDKGLTVSGSGELDNGWTFYVGTYISDAITISTHVTTLTMGSLGTIKVGQAFGGAGSGYDEEVPQAYEQTSDAFQNSANLVGASMDNNALVYASPSYDLGGASLSFDAAYSQDAHDNAVNNGGVGAQSDEYGEGVALGVTISAGALTVGIYGDQRESTHRVGTNADIAGDAFTGSWYAKYSAGPVSFGYQQSYYDSGLTGTGTAAATAKTVATATGYFEGEQMSIAFNVNDNLSISWTDHSDTYSAQDHESTLIADVEKSTDALQVAYSMGGMSIKAYTMDEDNPGYDSDAVDTGKSEVSLGLAF